MAVRKKAGSKAPKKPVKAEKPKDDAEFEVVDTEVLPIEKRSYRSRYSGLTEAVRQLSPGKSVVVPPRFVGEGDVDAQRNKLSSAIRRIVNTKSGFEHRLRFRQTEDGRIAISCEAKGQ